MKLFIFSILFLFPFISSIEVFSQTYTTKVSKSCGSCGKSVSSSSKVGDRCPNCGVIWGDENSRTKNTVNNSTYPFLKSRTEPSSAENAGVKSIGKKPEVRKDNSTATKKETEDWILSKLAQYVKQNYYHSFADIGVSDGYTVKEVRFEFDNFNLLIYRTRTGLSTGFRSSTTTYKITVPIYSIITVEDNHIRFASVNDEIAFNSINLVIIEENTETKEKTVTSSVNVDFRTNAETNLVDRLDAAFFHLKKFYKKPVSKEAF